MSEQKINPPEQFLAGQRRDAERQQAMGTVKAELAEEQRKAAESDPYGTWKTKMPLDLIGRFSQAELDNLHAHEEQAFSLHQQQAREKGGKRQAWLAGGGTEESFERNWQEWGEDAHNAGRAEEAANRATSPY